MSHINFNSIHFLFRNFLTHVFFLYIISIFCSFLLHPSLPFYFFVIYSRVEQPNNIAIWLSIFFGGISMLSKETGITVFLLNITYDLYRCWPLLLKRSVCDTSMHWTQKSQQFYQRLTKVLLSMSVLLAIRLALLQGSFPKFSQQDNPTAFHPNLYVRYV